jgi:RNA polymerase sigma factor (sigma-70 family)
MFPEYRDDFLQEGRMAILKANETFNGKVKLSTYAYVLIRNSIYDYANKMKIHYHYRPLPLNEAVVASEKSYNFDAAYVIEQMQQSEYYPYLRDYFIYEDSQADIANRYKTNQQNVSRIVVEFRERIRKELKDEEEK